MSEAAVSQLSFSDDIDDDHPPSKKLKLSPHVEKQPFVPLPDSPSSSDSLPTKATSKSSANAQDDEFDPIQAILEAGKKCQEEEEERKRTTSTDPKKKTDNESEKKEKQRDSDVVSVSESEEESDSDSEVTASASNSKKSEDVPAKRNVKRKSKKRKKKKSSNMRRNIKDILKHDQLDDLTIAARKEEEERKQRMNLKFQQQQQQLKFLQQQQQQLLQEAEAFGSSVAPELGNYTPDPGYNSYRTNDDLLMKRLMRKKHITVSLDEFGVPVQKTPDSNDVDCIQLSSDDDSEVTPLVDSSPHARLPQLPFNFNISSTYPTPSHSGLESELRRMLETKKMLTSSEVIALSSEEEDNARERQHDGPSLKDARLYDGASSTIGGREGGDSDDDCVIISPGPEGEEEVDDKDECSQDLLNVPDHLGRVLINVGHPDEDNDVFLPPQIAKIVKPHQIGGVRFLYDNVVESKDRYNKSTGFGCILAHAMGLGKTLQTVAFCDVHLRTAGKTVLIIVPINTIQNWLNEFNRYLPAKGANCNGTEHSIKRKTMNGRSGRKHDRNVNGTNQLHRDITLEQGSSKGSEDTLLNNSFDSALTLSTDLTSSVENADLPPEGSTSSQPESAGVGSSSSQDSDPAVEESEVRYRNFEVYLLNETVKSLQAREKTISTWSSKGGALLIGYEMYRMLALKKLKRSARRVTKLDHEQSVAEAESLDKIYECLVDPGPDCVICDEGHRIKNSGAGISQALKAIKTRRRVVLTGYPLQNNLMEYWCMVDFVRPNYLGTKAEFSNMFERPIQNGQCADSTYEDKRLMKFRSHVLHSLLEGFVQRRSHVVLRNALPPKEEWVFLVRLTPVQLKIYTAFMNYLRDDLDSDNASTNPIKAFAVCCKIWNHPDVLWNVVKKNLDLEMDLDIDEVNPVARPKSKPRRGTGRPRGRPPLNGISLAPHSFGFDQFEHGIPCSSQTSSTGKTESCSGISFEWAKPLFENYSPEVMENGVKFELLFMLLKETVAAGDRLLVFSQSLLTLDLIEIFLKKRLDWKKYIDYVRLDGSTAGLEREKLINEFNRNTVQKLFIISTRAGSLGINLVGANRVCIFDASWNPCHDSQAVCRVYRYGQTKPCHIYRFVADCTLEKRIYDRQVNKKGMADRIVDEMNPNTPFKSKDVSSFLVLQHDLLEKLPYIRWDLNIEKFADPVLRNVLQKMGDKITQEPFEHESLLIDQKHQKLSKTEKRLALKNYEKEKQTVANAYATYSRPNYSQYYSAIGTPPMNSSGGSYSPSYQMSSGGPYNTQTQSSMPLSSKPAETNGRFSSRSAYRSMENTSMDRFERHIIALKSRGISVFPVEIHQDTFLQDPSGLQDLCIRAGERVYILVSQKGTYLRIQSKLLRVPFVGTNITQEQAESFVMSVLQPSGSGNSLSSVAYPVEQKLPPSNSMLYQKNPNHLQITNSTNNSGGDVVMGGEANWNLNEDQIEPKPKYHQSRKKTTSHGIDGLGAHPASPSYNMSPSSSNFSRQTSLLNTRSRSSSHRNHSLQPDLQSLSRLETFCHRSASAFPFAQSPSESKRWSSPSTSNSETLNVGPSGDLEVTKVNHSQSSNSSNSSSSRTNSPYSKLNLNNSNDGSVSGGSASGAWANNPNTKDPSFYTDFTITPLQGVSAISGSSRPRVQQQAVDNLWDNSESRPPMSHEFLRQKQLLSMTGSTSDEHYVHGRSSSLHQYGLDKDKYGDSKFTEGSAPRSTPTSALDFALGNSNNASTSTGDSDGGNVTLRSLLKDNDKFKDVLGTSSNMFSGLNFNQNPKSPF